MLQGFYQRLAQGPLLADGAMGTELSVRGNLPLGTCLEHLNLTNPSLVRRVHLDYLEAGAELIETNTYGANRVKLEAYGLTDVTQEINSQAVKLAREAQRLAGQPVWLAGAVGPLGKAIEPLGPISTDEARDAFHQQITALVDAGVDLIILETFPSIAEVQMAIAVVKSVGDLPIIAQLTFTQEGRTPADDTPEEVANSLAPLGLAAIGTNCSVGSEPMLRVVEEMAPGANTRISALPNAGFPTEDNGRLVYLSSPAYMAEYAGRMLDSGAAIIGGCCGTTPAHVAAMREEITRHRWGTNDEGRKARITAPQKAARNAAAPSLEPTELSNKLGKRFVVTVEVHPPRGFDVSGTLSDLRRLMGRVNVDAFNCTDIPLAQGRMSALAMSSLIQTKLGVEAIMHMATRYRNLLALQSDLLGAHGLGVRNIFVFMGDPPSMGDYPQAVSFSDVTSSGLIRLIHKANTGVDTSDRPIEQPTSFFVGCALNLEAPDTDKERESLERKLEAGADFILTQAVFDATALERWDRLLGGFPKPVILGVLPLRSVRHAEFLHNEVPGMVVPKSVRQRMRDAGQRGAEVGATLARELLRETGPKIAGAYFIPSFGHYEAVADVLEGLPDLAAAAS